MRERRIELVAESDHSWLDLKRTGEIDQVMTVATPLKEAVTDSNLISNYTQFLNLKENTTPNLTQNPGYF